MKIEDMTIRQKRAYLNIKYAARWYIGGIENAIEDYDEEDEYHTIAKNELADHKQLIEAIYHLATTDLYDAGGVSFDNASRSALKDIKFCGKEWLMERIEIQVTKLGY